MTNSIVRTRFAPSPTGFIHIGNWRNTLFSYACAKRFGGEFIIRIEDTDTKRYVPGSAQYLFDMLTIFGLKPDKYPTTDQINKLGTFTGYTDNWLEHLDEIKRTKDEDFEDIYIQRQRLPIYQKYAFNLVEKGMAYFCFCTEERLASLRRDNIQGGYDGFCKKYSFEEAMDKIKKGKKPVIRLNVNAYREWKGVSRVDHKDLIMGKMTFPLESVNDQILIKSSGIPTYHLAVVIDDHLMGITHPIRSSEWISSTPKQVMLYEMLGWNMPSFLQPPVVLDPNGGKLSKRNGSVFLSQFLEEGYLPESILNFLMLLGWSPKNNKELFTLDEFVKEFEISKLNKANPVFNRQKLDWFNGKYIRSYENSFFVKKCKEWISKYCKDVDFKEILLNDKTLDTKLLLVKERMIKLSDIVDALRSFYEDPVPLTKDKVSQISNISLKDVDIIAKEYLDVFSRYDSFQNDIWVSDVRKIGDKYLLKHADVFMLIRLIVWGSNISPPLFESIQIIGKQRCIDRFNKFLNI